jgi:DNA repair exonuclease SbcCD ATPase subunit
MAAVKEDVLEHSLERFEAALIAEPSDTIEWKHNYRDTLRELDEAMREHVAATESPGGAMATLGSIKQQTVTTLDHRIDQLRTQHAELAARIAELNSTDEGCHINDAVAEIVEARQAGEKLLRQLRKHQHAERELLMDTINTDVGVGD